MMPLKAILKPPTILTHNTTTDPTSPPSQPTIPTPSSPPPPVPSLQNPPPAPNKIKRKPPPTLDSVIPPRTRFSLSANDKPQPSTPNLNQKQRLDRIPKKKVGFVTPVASYIPDPPPFTSESEYGEEEGSDEGYDHKLSETSFNRSDDHHRPEVEAKPSAPLPSRSAANPTISLDAILPPSQVAGTDAQASKEGKWTSRASERIKAGSKMLVGAGNSIRSLKRGFGGRGGDGG
ncbi:hypothetical protein G7Y79_00002g007930 [Physcia stellaris]|nr:hypothetical protein G7Y79_00002g007930 [Physcia stellaris]